jgi:hypothetical protein
VEEYGRGAILAVLFRSSADGEVLGLGAGALDDDSRASWPWDLEIFLSVALREKLGTLLELVAPSG